MNLKVLVATVLLCLVWSSLWGIIKFSLQLFPTFLFISVRLILAGLSLMLIQAVMKREILPRSQEWKHLIILSGITCFGFYASQTFAMLFVNSGLSAILVFTMPIFVGVLAHYCLNERLTLQKKLGLLLGGLGLVSILWPQLRHIHFDLTLVGELIPIGTGFFWACTSIYMKKYLASCDKLKMTIWQLLPGGIMLLLLSLSFESFQLKDWVTPQRLGLLLYIAVVGTGLAFMVWNWILSRVDAVTASISVMSIPILSLLWGFLFWHEALSLYIALGAVLICLGIICCSVRFSLFDRMLNRV